MLVLISVGCSGLPSIGGLPAFGDGTARPAPPTRPPQPITTIAPTQPVPTATAGSAERPHESSPMESPDSGTEARRININAFRKHLLRTERDMRPAFKALVRAGKARDIDAIIKAVARARTSTDKELVWLDAHDPAPCFSSVYNVWREAIALINEGLTVIEGALDPMDEAEGRRGLALFEQGVEILEQYVATRPATPCTRTPDGAHG